MGAKTRVAPLCNLVVIISIMINIQVARIILQHQVACKCLLQCRVVSYFHIGLWKDKVTLAGALQCQRAQNQAVILNGPWGESYLFLSLCFVCANIVNGPIQVSVMK